MKQEDTTGCCIRKDLNACWQTDESKCTSSFAVFKEDKVGDNELMIIQVAWAK